METITALKKLTDIIVALPINQQVYKETAMFILGAMFGGTIGVIIMCCLQINKQTIGTDSQGNDGDSHSCSG